MDRTRNTLLLNQGYQPIAVVPWQRAFCMHVRGKVEIVEVHDWQARSSTASHQVPSVVRLKGVVRYHKPKGVRFSRINVYIRDEYTCQYCNKKEKHGDLTLDHVIPRAQGGRTSWTNIVSCCVPCNRRKGNRTPEEAGMPLARSPTRPKYLRRRFFGHAIERLPHQWHVWIPNVGRPER